MSEEEWLQEACCLPLTTLNAEALQSQLKAAAAAQPLQGAACPPASPPQWAPAAHHVSGFDSPRQPPPVRRSLGELMRSLALEGEQSPDSSGCCRSSRGSQEEAPDTDSTCTEPFAQISSLAELAEERSGGGGGGVDAATLAALLHQAQQAQQAQAAQAAAAAAGLGGLSRGPGMFDGLLDGFPGSGGASASPTRPDTGAGLSGADSGELLPLELQALIQQPQLGAQTPQLGGGIAGIAGTPDDLAGLDLASCLQAATGLALGGGAAPGFGGFGGAGGARVPEALPPAHHLGSVQHGVGGFQHAGVQLPQGQQGGWAPAGAPGALGLHSVVHRMLTTQLPPHVQLHALRAQQEGQRRQAGPILLPAWNQQRQPYPPRTPTQAHSFSAHQQAQAPVDPPETLVGVHGRYQPYCQQVITPELNEAATAALNTVRLLQGVDPPGGRTGRKRFFCSLKEVGKVVLHARCLIVAPDVRPSPTAHMNPVKSLHRILRDANACRVPIIFALSRKGIGQVFGRDKNMSIVALMDLEGLEPHYFAMVQGAIQGREQYMQHFGGDGNLGAQPAPPQALGPVQPAGGPPYGGGRGPQAILDRLTAC